jgi:hypothetical protein
VVPAPNKEFIIATRHRTNGSKLPSRTRTENSPSFIFYNKEEEEEEEEEEVRLFRSIRPIHYIS